MDKLFHEYLRIEPEKAQAVTASGLELPNKKDEKLEVAKVLQVAEEVEGVKVGDRVVYKSYSIDEVILNEENLIFIKFEDIIGTL